MGLTLDVNMMDDKYQLAEVGGNPEFYTDWWPRPGLYTVTVSERHNERHES